MGNIIGIPEKGIITKKADPSLTGGVQLSSSHAPRSSSGIGDILAGLAELQRQRQLSLQKLCAVVCPALQSVDLSHNFLHTSGRTVVRPSTAGTAGARGY